MTLENILKVNIMRAHDINMHEVQVKIIHRRKFIFLNTYITKEKKVKNYYQDLQQKMMEKQIKPHINRKK